VFRVLQALNTQSSHLPDLRAVRSTKMPARLVVVRIVVAHALIVVAGAVASACTERGISRLVHSGRAAVRAATRAGVGERPLKPDVRHLRFGSHSGT
jgi:hypothetical protein